MIVEFDTYIRWKTPPAGIDDDSGRVYTAAPYPHCLVLILRELAAKELDMIPGNLHKGIYDCIIGDHDGSAFPDFCLPELAGYPHSKITVLRSADCEKPQMKLSEILAGAPTPQNSSRQGYVVEKVTVSLPPKLKQLLVEYAHRYQGEHPRNIDDFVATAIMNQIEELG